MKRIVYIVTVFIICFMLLCPMAAYAEEAEIETEITDNAAEANPEEDAPNIFTRLYEAFMDSKTDIFTLLGSGVLLVISLILKKDMGASSKQIINNISSVLSKTDISEKRQEAIVGGLNEMIDGYEDLKKQSDYVKDRMSEYADMISRIESSNEACNKKMEKMFGVVISLIDKAILQNEEVMEVMSNVFVNNNEIPQGLKNYIILKKSENAKLVHEATEICTTVNAKGGEDV